MKSSFLVSIVLSALVSVSAFAQTNRPARAKQKQRPVAVQQKPAKKAVAKPVTVPVPATTQTTTQAVTETKAAEKSAFDKFYDRLSINYFGVYTSPVLKKWNSANAAISKEWGDTGRKCTLNCDTYAQNVWNQVNFAYDFGWKMKFVFIPRWTVYLSNPRDMSPSAGEDRAMIGLEDFLTGFAGVIWASENKKVNWFIRPAMRLPTSHFTRHYENGAFGQITNQVELAHFITYDANAQWQFGLQMQQRMWVYDYRFNPSRLRFYTSPYVQYAINEKTRVAVYYQSMIENNKRWESVNGKKPIFKDYYQDVMVAFGRDLTDRFSIMPYIGYFVDQTPHSTQNAYLGSWISYKIH